MDLHLRPQTHHHGPSIASCNCRVDMTEMLDCPLFCGTGAAQAYLHFSLEADPCPGLLHIGWAVAFHCRSHVSPKCSSQYASCADARLIAHAAPALSFTARGPRSVAIGTRSGRAFAFHAWGVLSTLSARTTDVASVHEATLQANAGSWSPHLWCLCCWSRIAALVGLWSASRAPAGRPTAA